MLRRRNPLVEISDRVQALAQENRPVSELLAALQPVEDAAALLEMDNFGTLEGRALAMRAQQLGATREDVAFLEAKGAFLQGNFDRVAQILDPFAPSTRDLRLLHLWAQLPDRPKARIARLQAILDKHGEDRWTWSLLRQHAEEAGRADLVAEATSKLEGTPNKR